jgi:hypothetical protein
MPDQYADLIAGTVLAQELLVRHLEEQGVLEKGTFRSVLEEHMARISPGRRVQRMYGPIRGLIRALGTPALVPKPKH